MSVIKDTGEKLILAGKEYTLRFTLNALDEVQDHLGGYEQLSVAMNPETNPEWVKNLKWLLTLLINEGFDDETSLSEQQVGRLLTVADLAAGKTAILQAFTNGASELHPEAKDDDEGNEMSAQG